MSVPAALAWTGVLLTLTALFFLGAADTAYWRNADRLTIAAVAFGVLAFLSFLAAIWLEAAT